MPRTTDPITLATARKMALKSLSGVESRLAAEREYVSHDPHTVALLKPDALKRLEGWLEKRGRTRYMGAIERKRWGKFSVQLCWGNWLPGIGYQKAIGRDETLALAIHAALDQAEAPNGNP